MAHIGQSSPLSSSSDSLALPAQANTPERPARSTQEIKAEIKKLGRELVADYLHYAAAGQKTLPPPTEEKLPDTSLHMVREYRDGTKEANVSPKGIGGLVWKLKGAAADIDRIAAKAERYAALLSEFRAAGGSLNGPRLVRRPSWANTPQKASAATLIDRARRIGDIEFVPSIRLNDALTDDEMEETMARSDRARLDRFKSILDTARDPATGVGGKDLVDVVSALLRNFDSLGWKNMFAGSLLLQEALEQLNVSYEIDRHPGQEPDRQEILRRDECRYEIFDFLSKKPFFDFHFDPKKNAEFSNRLCSVLAHFETPETIDRLAASLEWAFLCEGKDASIDFTRFNTLLEFIENNLAHLSDSSKGAAIAGISNSLTELHDPAPAIVEFGGRVIGIGQSIQDDNARQAAAASLLALLECLPAGPTRSAAADAVGRFIDIIEDASSRNELKTVLQQIRDGTADDEA